MYIFGVKFEEHCSNISGDILDWVLHCFSGTTYDVITFVICIIQKCIYISKKENDIPKMKNAILLYFESLSNKKLLFFTS